MVWGILKSKYNGLLLKAWSHTVTETLSVHKSKRQVHFVLSSLMRWFSAHHLITYTHIHSANPAGKCWLERVCMPWWFKMCSLFYHIHLYHDTHIKLKKNTTQNFLLGFILPISTVSMNCKRKTIEICFVYVCSELWALDVLPLEVTGPPAEGES